MLRLEPGLFDGDAQDLARALVRGLKALPPGSLPLAAACRQGGMVNDSDLTLSVLALSAGAEQIKARVGVFFTEVVGGCNCNDDPVECNAYGILRIALDRRSGVAAISPDSD